MRQTLLAQLFIIGFLAIQLFLPAHVLWSENWETSVGYVPQFSWDMYARMYRFDARYRLVHDDGTRTRIRLAEHFPHTQLHRVIHASRLPIYHAWLCDRLRSERRVGELRGRVRVGSSSGTERALVDPSIDLCRAPNFGVLPD